MVKVLGYNGSVVMMTISGSAKSTNNSLKMRAIYMELNLSSPNSSSKILMQLSYSNDTKTSRSTRRSTLKSKVFVTLSISNRYIWLNTC
jgi:dihydroorotate dehydrogenase